MTTSAPKLYEKLVDYRVHGMRPKYYHHSIGGNFRIDALQAAILSIKLRHLDSWHEGCRENACRYYELFEDAGLRGRVKLPEALPDRYHIYNQFCIRFPEGRAVRDRVLSHLMSAGVGCDIYYPLTLPQQECFRNLPSVHQSFPNSEAAAAESLAIPGGLPVLGGEDDECPRHVALWPRWPIPD